MAATRRLLIVALLATTTASCRKTSEPGSDSDAKIVIDSEKVTLTRAVTTDAILENGRDYTFLEGGNCSTLSSTPRLSFTVPGGPWEVMPIDALFVSSTGSSKHTVLVDFKAKTLAGTFAHGSFAEVACPRFDVVAMMPTHYIPHETGIETPIALKDAAGVSLALESASVIAEGDELDRIVLMVTSPESPKPTARTLRLRGARTRADAKYLKMPQLIEVDGSGLGFVRFLDVDFTVDGQFRAELGIDVRGNRFGARGVVTGRVAANEPAETSLLSGVGAAQPLPPPESAVVVDDPAGKVTLVGARSSFLPDHDEWDFSPQVGCVSREAHVLPTLHVQTFPGPWRNSVVPVNAEYTDRAGKKTVHRVLVHGNAFDGGFANGPFALEDCSSHANAWARLYAEPPQPGVTTPFTVRRLGPKDTELKVRAVTAIRGGDGLAAISILARAPGEAKDTEIKLTLTGARLPADANYMKTPQPADVGAPSTAATKAKAFVRFDEVGFTPGATFRAEIGFAEESFMRGRGIATGTVQ